MSSLQEGRQRGEARHGQCSFFPCDLAGHPGCQKTTPHFLPAFPIFCEGGGGGHADRNLYQREEEATNSNPCLGGKHPSGKSQCQNARRWPCVPRATAPQPVLTNREELSFFTVLAFPKASRIGLACSSCRSSSPCGGTESHEGRAAVWAAEPGMPGTQACR